MSSTLTCPKCSAPMRTYERNGVHVDQCTDCRGIFLDRGELEHLVDAETRHYEGSSPAPAPAAAPAPAPAPRADDYRDRDRDRDRDDDRGGYKKKKSKTSFLSDLLEM